VGAHEGRVALVTGASRGLGAAIATRLAREGAGVGLVARTASALEEVAEAIRSEGGAAAWHAADVADPEAAGRAVTALEEELGGIDLLVNNAAGTIRRRADEYTLEEWEGLLRVLLTAPFDWSRRVAASMRRRRFGRIVNVGSVAGMVALPTGAAYASAKAGLAMLTRCLAREWGPDGVTVNLVAPWYVPTALTEGVLADAAWREAVLRATPTGRLGTPEEVAAAVSFLCGEEAGWINGVCLPLDGGFSAASFWP
jgi:NAD(P)-dependent dehydrogenase (short-subunit alcohol dehydrogenase family)